MLLRTAIVPAPIPRLPSSSREEVRATTPRSFLGPFPGFFLGDLLGFLLPRPGSMRSSIEHSSSGFLAGQLTRPFIARERIDDRVEISGKDICE